MNIGRVKGLCVILSMIYLGGFLIAGVQGLGIAIASTGVLGLMVAPLIFEVLEQ